MKSHSHITTAELGGLICLLGLAWFNMGPAPEDPAPEDPAHVLHKAIDEELTIEQREQEDKEEKADRLRAMAGLPLNPDSKFSDAEAKAFWKQYTEKTLKYLREHPDPPEHCPK